MTIIILILTALLTLFTLLPLSRLEHWCVRSLDFPRLQILTALGLLLVAQLVFLDLARPISWIMISVTSLCAIYQGRWIIPYTPLHPVEVRKADHSAKGSEISVMTANVLLPNRNWKGLIRIIEDCQPDLLITLETDEWWQSKLDGALTDYPHTVKCPLDNLYGMHLYSRFSLKQTEIAYLVEQDIPSIHTLVTLPGGRELRCHFVHPAPPSPTENEKSGQRDAELIIVARSVAESDLPVIVTGDLNDVGWSATTQLFKRISGLLDPRVGRGMFNTFNAQFWPARWPLDHIFHSPHFLLERIERLDSFGSDHFPIFAKLSLKSSDGDHSTNPTPHVDDIEWAKSKTSKQDVSRENVPNPESANEP